MGGEGAMMAAIASLKNNNRRKKRTQFDKEKVGGFGDGEKVEFDFPEVTPAVIRTIRDRLLSERRKLFLKRAILFAIIISILIAIILY